MNKYIGPGVYVQEINLGDMSLYNKRTMTYADLKQCVDNGDSLEWIQENLRPVGVNPLQIEDLYYRAKRELWEENELVKTNTGRLLYV